MTLFCPSRQRVGSRCVGGRVEGVGDVAVEAFEEVSVDVEDGPHRGVAEPRGDHGWVGSLVDEERHVGMPHVMKLARFTDGGAHRGFPETGAEAGTTQRSACGCGSGTSTIQETSKWRWGSEALRVGGDPVG